MRTTEIVAALSSLPTIEVTKSGTLIRGYVPAIEDGFRLAPRKVLDYEHILGPTGEPAIRFAMRSADEIQCFIVTDTDVVYPPATSKLELDSDIQIGVVDTPGPVAYSEMTRDAEQLAVSCERHGISNLDALGGSLLLLRRVILGAVVFGLHPVAAVIWWRRAWNAVKDDLWLPFFRSNPAWDNLEKHAAGIEMHSGSMIIH